MGIPQTWPLTGRAEEIGLISDVLSGRDPYAGIAIIGPAGVGKSRLAHEAGAVAARAGSVLRTAVATQSGQAIPLGAFAEWARDTDSRPLQAVSSVIDGLTATTRGRPILVVVDDAHRLDDVSAFMLHQLVVRRLATVVTTVRSGESAPDAVTSLWKDGHLRLLRLQPLARNESDALLAEVLCDPVDPESADRMWQLTNGNVLQLRHLVEQEVGADRLTRQAGRWHWTGGLEISGTLTDLIDTQVGAIPESVLEAVDLVAVGEPLSLELLATMVDGAVVEDAERRGLLTVTPGPARDLTVRVGHPLYGEIRRRRAGALRLRRLRGRVAQALVGKSDLDDNDLLRAAALWLDSDVLSDPALLLRAAHIAFYRFDLGLAERLAAASADAGWSPGAVLLRAQAQGLMNRGEEAEQLLDTLDLSAMNDHDAAYATALRIGTLWGPLNRPDDAEAFLLSALAHPNPVVAAAARCLHCYTLATAGRPAEALAEAESIDRTGSGGFVSGNLIGGQLIALGDMGRIAEVRPLAEVGYRQAAQQVEAAFLGIGIAEVHVRALLLAGAVSEAISLARNVTELCADVPGPIGAMGSGIVGLAALGAGHLDEARQALDSMARTFTSRPSVAKMRSRFAIAHLEVFAKLGAIEAAAAIAELLLRPPLHPELTMLEPDRLIAMARLDAARGAFSKARAGAHQSAEIARSRGQFAREVVSLQTATHFGDSSTAARLAELSQIASGHRVELAAAFAAALARADGAQLRTVSERFESMGDLFAAADAAAHATIAYRRAGLRGAAITAAGRAQRIAEVCGGVVSPALMESRQPLPLTAREREIIHVVAQGLSNRRIAEELCMSVRTVEGHIYRASQRAGTNSRDQLAALLGEFQSAESKYSES